MSIKTVLILLTLLFSMQSFAAVTSLVISENTASAVNTSDPENIIVYGGLAGTCSANPGSETLCDTCPAVTSLATPKTCNSRSIHIALNLVITFRVDAFPTGSQILIKSGDNQITPIDPPTGAELAANQDLVIKIPWTQVVASLTSDSTNDLHIGISTATSSTDYLAEKRIKVEYRYADSAVAKFHSDGSAGTCTTADEGFCNFSVFPGDGKVYVQNLIRGTVSPGVTGTASGIRWKALRVYYAVGDGSSYAATVPSTASYKDLTLNNPDDITSTVTPGSVDGLQNDTSYVFRIASVDEAGNVDFFSSDAYLSTPAVAMDHAATPGEVIGLLDDKRCFIATAAFGSAQSPYVFILRQFRDHFLKTNAPGRAFVEFYYEHSPVIAHFIARHETLRAAVRLLLWPFIGFADLSLAMGLWFSMTLLLVLLSVTFLVFKKFTSHPRPYEN